MRLEAKNRTGLYLLVLVLVSFLTISEGARGQPSGMPLEVSLYTDKPVYRVGEIVNINIQTNKDASASMTITMPSGYQMVTKNVELGGLLSLQEQASNIGRWSVAFQVVSGTESANVVTHYDVAASAFDVSVQLVGLPTAFRVSLSVDGQYQGPLIEDQTRILSFKSDTSNTITIPQSTEILGVLYFCSQNTWVVSSPGFHTFAYAAQVTTVSTSTTSSASIPPPRPDSFWALVLGIGVAIVAVVSVLIFAVKSVLPSSRICKRCGTVNPKYAKSFCIQCGEPLRT